MGFLSSTKSTVQGQEEGHDPLKGEGESLRGDPLKVVCTGEGLRFGYLNRPIRSLIDTRHAGPGELSVFCLGPERHAYCELTDHNDGMFTLRLSAQDVGDHELHVMYDAQEVQGSPFQVRVSPASLVKTRGPGLDDGLLNTPTTGKFVVDTHEAGPGDITVRVGGPKGAFQVRTEKVDRTLICQYRPRDPGLYFIDIIWSGDHVPGSPFKVYLCTDGADLQRHRAAQSTA